MNIRLYFYFLSIFSLFTTSLFARGAGVLPMAVDVNGDPVVLLGKQSRYSRYSQSYFDSWSDFGGKQKQNEPLNVTAFKKFQKQTGYTSFSHIKQNDIDNAPFVEQDGYREYFLDLSKHRFVPANDIYKKAATARKRLGSRNRVRKSEWRYINAEQLLEAMQTSSTFVPIYNTQTGEPETLYRFVGNALHWPQSESIIERFIRSVKQNKLSNKVHQPAANKGAHKPIAIQAQRKLSHSTTINKNRTIAPRQRSIMRPVVLNTNAKQVKLAPRLSRPQYANVRMQKAVLKTKTQRALVSSTGKKRSVKSVANLKAPPKNKVALKVVNRKRDAKPRLRRASLN